MDGKMRRNKNLILKKIKSEIYNYIAVPGAAALFSLLPLLNGCANDEKPEVKQGSSQNSQDNREKPGLEDILNQTQASINLNDALYMAGLNASKTNPEFSRDGKRILFAYDSPERGEIYEIGLNGQGLRKITKRVPLDDSTTSEPFYLPDGDIGFAHKTPGQGEFRNFLRSQICEVPSADGPREPKDFIPTEKLNESPAEDIKSQYFTPRGTKVSQRVMGNPRIEIDDKLVEQSIGISPYLNREETEMLTYVHPKEYGLGKPGIYVQKIKDWEGNLKPEEPRLIEGTEKFRNPKYLTGYNNRFVIVNYGGDRDGGGLALIDKEKWQRGEEGYVVERRELGYNPGDCALYGSTIVCRNHNDLSVLDAREIFKRTLGGLEYKVEKAGGENEN